MLSLILLLFGVTAGTPSPAVNSEGLSLLHQNAMLWAQVERHGPAGFARATVPSDTLSRAPEWAVDGRHVVTLFPSIHAEDWLASHSRPEREVAAGRAALWFEALPVRFDVRNGGVYVALRLRAP
jgi:hypothetical protein